MDSTQAQVLANWRSLFGRYKAVVTQDDRVVQITVNKTTTEVNKPRSIATHTHRTTVS